MANGERLWEMTYNAIVHVFAFSNHCAFPLHPPWSVGLPLIGLECSESSFFSVGKL